MFKTDNRLIKAAIIDGVHPYDVPGFRDLFRSIEDIDPYHQAIDNWAVDCGGVRDEYDVLLFYNSNPEPNPECQFIKPKLIETLGEIGKAVNQGIVVLHHGLLAYPNDQNWSQIVGIANRAFGFHMDQTFKVEIAQPAHPIVQGLSDWIMFDETYTMDSADEASEILLTTQHEKSMRTIAWTRQFRSARVFCYQLGHDARSWIDPNFREILTQGIRWAAGRL
ncbi:MAG: ThuA domain-containing protein [bacterium]